MTTTADASGLRRHNFVIRYLTLFGGEVLSKLCVLAAFAFLARVLTPADFGRIELGGTTTIFMVLAAEMGLGTYGARLIGTAPGRASELLPRIGLVRFALAVPLYAVVLALMLWQGTPRTNLLAIYALVVLLTPLNTPWVFQGLRQMQWVAMGNLLRYGTFATLVLLLVRRGGSTTRVAVAEVSGALALACFNAVVVGRVLRIRLDWRGAWAGARTVLREGWFLGASDLTWAAMFYAPTMILGWTGTEHAEQVAWIAASVRIVQALHAFVFLYFFNMVPNLAKDLHEGVDSWRALIRRSLSLSMWPACLIAAGGTLLAPVLMTVLYGSVYTQAVLPFQIVVWMIPVAWFSGHFRFSLIVAGRQNLEFLASAAAGLVTAASAFLVSHEYGAAGAALALLAGGVVNALLAGVLMTRAIGPVRLGAAAPAIATCLATVALGIGGAPFIGQVASVAVAFVLFGTVMLARLDLRDLMNTVLKRAA